MLARVPPHTHTNTHCERLGSKLLIASSKGWYLLEVGAGILRGTRRHLLSGNEARCLWGRSLGTLLINIVTGDQL